MDRPLAICLITASYWPAWGGAEGQCRMLARELCRRGHRVVVLTRGREDAPGEELADGVIVRRIPAHGAGHFRSLMWTAAAALWLRRHGRELDVFQCYQLLSPAHAGILGRRRRDGQPIVVRPACSGVDGDLAEVRRLPLTWVRRRLLRTVDAFVTLTGAIEAELAEFGLGDVPSCRIPNAVDASRFRPAAGEERRLLRARLGLPEERVVCLFLGRLVPQKDPGLLVEAWLRWTPREGHLLLVGDGPLRLRLEAEMAGSPRKNEVSFRGATSDVIPFLQAADLLVLPSRAEGMPTVVLEAMACGLPVVATDVPGNREVLGDDCKVGLLVPPGDAGRLAQALEAVLGDAELRVEMGRRGRELVQQYDLGRVTDAYLALYERLLTGTAC